MARASECEREIRDLHEFFVDWYTGAVESDAFERVEAALHPHFVRVAPTGDIADRESVLRSIRHEFDCHDFGTFDIEIRNVDPVVLEEEYSLVRYEECQRTTDGTNGRLSTVLFTPPSSERRRAPVWRHLQETWLDAPFEDD